ncbi:ABA4-like family protein [Pelagibacteraceae bacterium]|nr:ABA4-like family protein [Pelagibacteraceae bacterium]
MINTLDTLLTFENIYLFANWGVVPFWLLLILMPGHNITKFFSHSIIAPLLLAAAYIFVAKQIILEENIFEGFKLYLGLDGLDEIYSNESLRLVFWLHFLSISLFIGAWIARDAERYMVPKVLSAPCILVTYFTGPLGIVIYWFVRIFYAKKINFNE